MLRQFVTSALLATSLLVAPGCDGGDTEARAYVDGQEQLTDDGEFTITLMHEDGEPAWGMNSFLIRVAMPDPNDPEAEGKGVPNLDVDLAAWMSDEDHEMDVVPTVTYEGDGFYRVDGVLLDSAGSWTLDFQVSIGAIVESARFSFALEA